METADLNTAKIEEKVEKRPRQMTEKGRQHGLQIKEKALKKIGNKLEILINEVDSIIEESKDYEEVRRTYKIWMVQYEDFIDLRSAYLSLLNSIENPENTEFTETLSSFDEHFEAFKAQMDSWLQENWKIETEIVETEIVETEIVEPGIVFNDGVSQISKHSHFGKKSQASYAESLTSVKLKEEQKRAELIAKMSMLEKKQELEMKKLRLKIEEESLDLNRELAITYAKSKVLEKYDTLSNVSRISDHEIQQVVDQVDSQIQSAVDDHVSTQEQRPNTLEPADTQKSLSCVSYPRRRTDSSRHESLCPLTSTRKKVDAPLQSSSEMIMTVVKQLKKPTPEIKTFSGDPLYFKQFMRQFRTKVVCNTDNDDEKMNYLEQFTSGEANRIVRGYSYLDAEQGYPAALRELEDRYGDDETVANAFVRRALDWPEIKSDNPRALNDFAIFLAECENAVQCIAAVKVLEFPENIKRLVKKLPIYYHDKWRSIVQQVRNRNASVTFHELSEFVKVEARKANHPIYGREALHKDTKPSYTKKGFMKGKGSFAASMSEKVDKKSSFNSGNASGPMNYNSDKKRTCFFCNVEHMLSKCSMFGALPNEDKIRFLKSRGMCFKCFRRGHLSRDCRFDVRCDKCQGSHQTVLHSTALPSVMDTSKPSALSACADHSTGEVGASDGDCTMAIIPVKVKLNGGHTVVDTYAFLDPGSSVSFCTESLFRRLGGKGKRMNITLDTMGTPHTMSTFCVSGLEVCDLDLKNAISLPKVYTKDRMPVSTSHIPTAVDISYWSHLKDVKLPQMNAGIDLLIGNNIPDAYSPLELRTGPRGSPHATRTLLGWIVWNVVRQGRDSLSKYTVNMAEVIAIQELEHLSNLENMVRHAMNIDFPERVTDDKKEYSVEDKRFIEKVESSIELKEGHYYIDLPFRNYDIKFPDNSVQALQRLKSLKKKMLTAPKFKDDYQEFMSNILDRKYAEKISVEEIATDQNVWYIPHHGIYHPRKPDKIRVVFDCTSAYQGVSLNSQLLPGPDLTNNLIGILLRFRQESIAIMSDIESMFYQVRVRREDADCLRFYWWPGGDISKEPAVYRMLVHLFGAVSSPSCSNAALLQTAKDNEDDFEADVVQTLRKNFYVDDCLTSVKCEEQAIDLVQKLSELCMKGGFRLTKWLSNSHAVMDTVPLDERAKDVKHLDLSCEDLPNERALGVYWFTESDHMGYKIQVRDKPTTRRGILSVVSSVYDPLGFASPFILLAKVLLQELCRLHIGWDDPIPDEIGNKWNRWLQELPNLENVRISRCYKPNDFGAIQRYEIHMFSDASENGYGAVGYLRVISEKGLIHCSLLIAKSRVSPLKKTTVPRMELTAATLSVRLCKQLQNELDFNIHSITYWTDSMAVLCYIGNESSRFHTFVANRVAVIRDGSDPEQWKYIVSQINPADLASRGKSVHQFLDDKCWFCGPAFLWDSDSQWPQFQKETLTLSTDDVEVKKKPVNVAVDVKPDAMTRLMNHFSSWNKLKRTVAWLLKLKHNLYNKIRNRDQSNATTEHSNKTSQLKLTPELLQEAEIAIVKFVQHQYFMDEIESLKNMQALKRSSTICKLDPILVDGVLRVDGRLDRAELSYDAKHPILLPKDSVVTELILSDIHQSVGHLGRNSILSELRRKFWIPGAGGLIKSLVSKCVICRKYQAAQGSQKMADLPLERLKADDPPFTYVGVDYFGPFFIKRGRAEMKRYGVLFTCLTVRAVHLEIAHSLDTDACINALRRFLARRGPVKYIRSDNGTNLVGCEKELRENIANWNQQKIHQFLLQKQIKWEFNPPYGSHHGGVWERIIRSVRKVLYSVLKQQVVHLDDECLHTVFCEVEDILNNRPITHAPSSVHDLNPLTPNHLLKFRGGDFLPPGSFDKNDMYVKRRWRQVQYLADLFWTRWVREYLPLLQERQKWIRPSRNLSVGDVVLLVENSPRNSWCLGRVTDVNRDRKGYVRSVKVRTRFTELVRPVDKLCLILEAEC